MIGLIKSKWSIARQEAEVGLLDRENSGKKKGRVTSHKEREQDEEQSKGN